jgi:hypothetical protein
MQVRPRHPAAPAYQAYPLAPVYHLALPYFRFAQVKVGRHQPRAMVDVDRTPCQIEISDQSDHSPSRRAHRRSDGAGEIGTHVSVLDFTIVDPGCPEAAGDAAGAGKNERSPPQAVPFMGSARHLAALRDLRLDPQR